MSLYAELAAHVGCEHSSMQGDRFEVRCRECHAWEWVEHAAEIAPDPSESPATPRRGEEQTETTESKITPSRDSLLERQRQLVRELTAVRKRISEIYPGPKNDYRIALRPDDDGHDPMRYDTRLDDIVVRDVAMFRAEQMDTHSWWVACYLDNETRDRICWNVSANARPKRIDWVTTEFPEVPGRYEHEASP